MKQNFTFTKIRQFIGHKDAIYSFCFNHKNNIAYTVGADGYIVQWDVFNDANGVLLLQSSEAFYSCFLCEKTNRLFAGSRLGGLFVIDIEQKKLIAQKPISNKSIYFIQEFLDNYYLGDEAGVLFQLSENLDIIRKIQVSNSALRSIDVFENKMAIGTSDYSIYLLDENMDIINSLSGHTNSVFAVRFLSKDILATTGRDALLKIWDITTGKEQLSVPAHMYQAKSIDFNGKYLLTSSMDKSIKLWNLDLNLLKVASPEKMVMHTNCINKVMWLNQDQFLSCSDDKTLILWKLHEGE